MEANGMSGRNVHGMSCVTLGLELPQQQQIFPPHNRTLLPSYTGQEFAKHNTFPYPTKPKQQQLSDEDEAAEGEKRISQWQRMKWTDSMVRLLIMVVFYIGDDCNNTDAASTESNGPAKKKPGGVLQKKGKWKSVSRAMMEKGFYVSPQQCEDKFNDLNKRYKRVNDILGKGTACKVVEDQSLLDSMDHLTPKMKEEVRKLLNSKHLFFREMCAYHTTATANCNTDPALESSRNCFHSPENGAESNKKKNKTETSEDLKNTKRGARQVVDVEDDDDDDDDNEEDDNDDQEETGGSGGCGSHDNNGGEMVSSSKRQRRETFSSPLMKQMSCELVSVLQDGTKSPREQQLWMMGRTLQLEEQRVRYQCQAFELEKQRLKWIKFSAKKERDMERMKLSNDRMRLENERMLLLLRKKELELIQPQQSSNQKALPG